MKNMIGKNGLLLGGFALITAGLISLTYLFTSPVIQAQRQAQLLATLNTLVDHSRYDNDLQSDCTYIRDSAALGTDEPMRIFRARAAGQPEALILETVAPNGYNGRIELIVGVNLDGSVTDVRVLNHQETPGLGDKIDIRISDWITSFSRKSIQPGMEYLWAVKKDGGQFDQFTGATITPRAVVSAVKKTVQYAQQNQESLFSAPNECETSL